ncbi:AAA family ATPase [Pseudomonas aeruginosa]|uniref:AAA family ATPase n=1 Tax=Pseudomonas aeruginosa TaxID=287 RepID=UPI0032B5EEE7
MNNVAKKNITVEEIKAAHIQAVTSQKFEEVMVHELFGFSTPLKGFEDPIPVPAERHPLSPRVDSNYVFNESLVRRVLLSMATKDSIMLVGEKGTGKSSLINQINGRLNRPSIAINAGPGVDEGYLVGFRTLGKDGVKSVDGVLSYAYRHGLSCTIDEICSLNPGVLLSLNDILQGDEVVTLKHHGIDPELDPRELLGLQGGMNIVRHPSFRLFATDNTGGKSSRDPRYAGTKGQNAAVRSRFTSFKANFMSAEKEMAALHGLNTGVDDLNIQLMVEFAFRFRVAFSQEEAFDNISFRELKRWVTKMALYDDLDESFVDAIYGNLEEADQALARELFDETFDRDLVLPEEYTTSVADQLDALTKAAVSNAAQIA